MNVTLHPAADRLQDWLEGLASPAEAEAVRAHVDACAACRHDVALYRQVFAALDQVPLVEPAFELDSLVLARVLPWRRRRRQLAILGWGYAGLAAACAAIAAGLLGTTAGRRWVEQVSGVASHALLQAGFVAMNALGYVTLHAASGWGRLTNFGLRFEPLARALRDAFGQPALVLLVAAAIALSAAMLGWLRTRAGGESHAPGIRPEVTPHVLMLRF
jgi:putative zinc finger protein